MAKDEGNAPQSPLAVPNLPTGNINENTVDCVNVSINWLPNLPSIQHYATEIVKCVPKWWSCHNRTHKYLFLSPPLTLTLMSVYSFLVKILQNSTRKSTIRTMAYGCSTNRWEFICCSQKMRYTNKKPSKVNKWLHKREHTRKRKIVLLPICNAIDLLHRKVDFSSNCV